jgi:hypothetical protein
MRYLSTKTLSDFGIFDAVTVDLRASHEPAEYHRRGIFGVAALVDYGAVIIVHPGLGTRAAGLKS